MNDEWGLVWRGFAVSFVGFVAIVLYILGLSKLYVGGWGWGSGCLVGAVVFCILFNRILGPYLDILEAREIVLEEDL
jgi:hypothetical protein